jgi:hypothetical protein
MSLMGTELSKFAALLLLSCTNIGVMERLAGFNPVNQLAFNPVNQNDTT